MNCKNLTMRAGAILLSMAMLLCAFTVTASAADPHLTLKPDDVALYSGSLQGGYYTAKVPIKVTQNAGFVSLRFKVTMPDGVKLTDISQTGSIWSESTGANYTEELEGEATGSYTFFFVSAEALKDVTATGTLTTLTFKIPEAQFDGVESVNIGIEVIEATSQGDYSGVDPTQVQIPAPTDVTAKVSPLAGKITLATELLGDINLDGVFNSNDAVYFMKTIALPGIFTSQYAGSRDFNNDGSVNSDDAVYLMKHYSLSVLFPLFPNS